MVSALVQDSRYLFVKYVTQLLFMGKESNFDSVAKLWFEELSAEVSNNLPGGERGAPVHTNQLQASPAVDATCLADNIPPCPGHALRGKSDERLNGIDDLGSQEGEYTRNKRQK